MHERPYESLHGSIRSTYSTALANRTKVAQPGRFPFDHKSKNSKAEWFHAHLAAMCESRAGGKDSALGSDTKASVKGWRIMYIVLRSERTMITRGVKSK
jgi:hypothetical protein